MSQKLAMLRHKNEGDERRSGKKDIGKNYKILTLRVQNYLDLGFSLFFYVHFTVLNQTLNQHHSLSLTLNVFLFTLLRYIWTYLYLVIVELLVLKFLF